MKRMAIIVEGETEMRFVSIILQPFFFESLAIYSINLKGNVSLERLAAHIGPLAHSHDLVTTMVDYYGFAKARDVPIDDLETKIGALVPDTAKKIIPYVQQHEFEALLFSDKEVISSHLGLKEPQQRQLNSITGAPEDINHDNPPSKRIKKIHPIYEKRLEGVEILKKIGLCKIRAQCPRFNRWITMLGEKGSPNI